MSRSASATLGELSAYREDRSGDGEAWCLDRNRARGGDHRPLRALIAGYEAQAKADGARIEDLSREVRELREKVKELRKALDHK